MARRRVRILFPGALLTALVAFGVSGCTSSRSSAQSRRADPPASVTEFCGTQGQREISTSLGVAAEHVTTPSRSGHAYSCRYTYPNGAIGLSVTRFPTSAAAAHHFQDVGRQRGRRPEPPQLGEGLHAFMATDGSVVVRKARDVLDVDVAALPAQFGNPPQTTSLVALAVAVTIIGHWSPG